MARARNIKPGFFKNEVLAELPFHTRLLFIGLWTHADREGRFEVRGRRIKAELFPYDDVNVDDAVAELCDAGFINVYEVDGVQYGQVVNWSKHQNPHHKEAASVIPATDGHADTVCAGYVPLTDVIRRRIYARDGRKCAQCGSEKALSIDHIIPVSRGGNSVDENLQVLCLSCNCRKKNTIQCMDQVRAKHDSSMSHAQLKQNASCPTDSLNPITDSLNPIDGDAPSPRGKPRKRPIPADFGISERVTRWAAEKGYTRLPERLERFVSVAKAKGYQYIDWDEAFMNAIRDDWAKFGHASPATRRPEVTLG